jgi:hypothetical protein
LPPNYEAFERRILIRFSDDPLISVGLVGTVQDYKYWIGAFEKNIQNNSTSEERNFEHKSLACSFALNALGEKTNLKVERSSGDEEIDNKAIALLTKISLRNIQRPPLARRIIVSFSENGSMSVGFSDDPSTLL